MKILSSLLMVLLAATAVFAADPVAVEMRAADPAGAGAVIGTVTVTATPYGTLLTPNLSGLTPGLHGFHVHEHPSCEPKEQSGKAVPALGAGGHYDPGKTGKHLGPYADGHLGDLPPLFADAAGRSTLPVLAPRLKPEDLKGRSLMVHAGGDNYADQPEPLGGGGPRVACGIVK
ncbi:MAG TPA: superoxide dismutase [Cu-Zn] SodC [Desulfobacterales bacterium]|nr:superoxide dismutase [Cu-Zn] SodC [Desulfobacterales bacterium]